VGGPSRALAAYETWSRAHPAQPAAPDKTT
jgi:hypothetical protein